MTQLVQKQDVERLVRTRLREQVEGFSDAMAPQEDLQFAGVKSMDLLVVLSRLEQDFDIVLDEVTVAKGHTIKGIVDQIWLLLPSSSSVHLEKRHDC